MKAPECRRAAAVRFWLHSRARLAAAPQLAVGSSTPKPIGLCLTLLGLLVTLSWSSAAESWPSALEVRSVITRPANLPAGGFGPVFALSGGRLTVWQARDWGRVAVFDVPDPAIPTTRAIIDAPDQSHDNPSFGAKLAFLGSDRLFIGNSFTSASAPHDGRIYAYDLATASPQLSYRQAQDPHSAGYFGWEVSIAGDIMVCAQGANAGSWQTRSATLIYRINADRSLTLIGRRDRSDFLVAMGAVVTGDNVAITWSNGTGPGQLEVSRVSRQGGVPAAVPATVTVPLPESAANPIRAQPEGGSSFFRIAAEGNLLAVSHHGAESDAADNRIFLYRIGEGAGGPAVTLAGTLTPPASASAVWGRRLVYAWGHLLVSDPLATIAGQTGRGVVHVYNVDQPATPAAVRTLTSNRPSLSGAYGDFMAFDRATGPNGTLIVGRRTEPGNLGADHDLEVLASGPSRNNSSGLLQGLAARWRLEGNGADDLGLSPGTTQNVTWVTSTPTRNQRLVASFGVGAAAGLTIPKTTAFDLPATGYSIMGWVRSPTYAPAPSPNAYFTLIASQGVGGQQEDAFILRYSSHGLNFQCSSLDNYPNPDPGYRDIKFSNASNEVLVVNNWHHIAVTYDGVRFRGYKDGVELSAAGNTLLNGVAPKRTSRTTTLGMRNNGATGIYDPLNNGMISDVRIYHRGFTGPEIQELYASEAATPQYAITTFNPQPVAAGGQVTLTGTFPTGSVPVIMLENAGSTTAVATLTPGSNSASQVVATVPAGTASGTYGLRVKFGTAGTSVYADLGIQTFVVGAGGGTTPTTGLALFLPFSDQTTDASPARRTITASNVTFGPGPNSTLSRAAYFDGQLSRLDFSPNLASTNELTLSLWIRNTREGPGLGHVFVDWDDAAGNDTGLFVYDSRVVLFANKNGANLGWTSPDQVLRPGAGWRHLIWVMTPTFSILYLDGNLYAQVPQSGSNTGFKLRSNVGYFNYAGGKDYFQGFLSNFRIYERALSAAEVSQLYASESTATPTDSVPSVVTHPADQTLQVGQPLKLLVTAMGSTPLTYQWLRNGNVLTGATNSNYAVANATATDAGTYTVLVQNTVGSIYSNRAAVTVGNPTPTVVAPAITTQPQGRTVDAGMAVTLTVAATGTEPLTYLWLRNGAAVPGATTDSLRIASAGPEDAGTYTARVANEQGAVVSNPAKLEVNQLAVQVSQDPAAPGVGSRVSFTATASPAGTYRHQWLRNGQPVAGQTGATLTMGFVTPANSGAYACVVTNAAGTSLTSATRQLDVSTGSAELRIVNTSTRLFVGTGDQVLITGLVLVGSGARSLLVRAVGPGLSPFGVTGVLSDPQLSVYLGGTVLASNNDWTAALGPIMSQVGAFALPAASRDSALVVSLPAGAYTFMVSGANNSSGIALLEVYELP